MTLPDLPDGINWDVDWLVAFPEAWLREIARVTMYAARVEDRVHHVYWYYLGVSAEKGKILTADARPKRLGEDIIKFANLKCKNSARASDIKSLILEYDAQSVVRNRIIHWIWSSVSTNSATLTRPKYKGPKDHQLSRS